MARPGLKAGLITAIRRMATDRQEVYIKNLQLKINGGVVNVNLNVKPLPDLQTGSRGLMMVMFEELESSGGKAADRKPPRSKRKSKSEEVRQLEDELQYTKENLQTTIEELETSNEELKSTNEELQSTNEELQSTNEELETSKEELQSLNEESATVNAELQSRIDELSRTNDDMKNLLAATQIATIFLDIDLCIKRFTPKATEIVPLTPSDEGRPINHFAANLKEVNLLDLSRQVLEDLSLLDTQIKSRDNRNLRMRIIPYRTVNNVIEGVVITFDDITELVNIEKELNQHYRQLRRLVAVVNDSNDAVTLQDLQGNILAWNKGAVKMYGYSEAEALKMNIIDIVPKEKQKEALAMIARLKEERVDSFETQRITKSGRILDIWLTVTRTVDDDGKIDGIATTERDLAKLVRLKA